MFEDYIIESSRDRDLGHAIFSLRVSVGALNDAGHIPLGGVTHVIDGLGSHILCQAMVKPRVESPIVTTIGGEQVA